VAPVPGPAGAPFSAAPTFPAVKTCGIELEELFRAVDAARNEMLGVDDLDDAQLEALVGKIPETGLCDSGASGRGTHL
jgi:hypothetical protein